MPSTAVEPTVQIVGEALWVGDKRLYATVRKLTFRAGRLLATQVLARVPATSDGQQVHLAAAQVLAALRSVFVLDPVPHLMRQFVPRRDDLVRRDADNLPAAVASLLEDPATAEALSSALSRLGGDQG